MTVFDLKGERAFMSITLIWAMSRNRVIGRNNALPWRLPADLKYFKAQTTGKTILMGRSTWESIGSKPLPGRRNIVLTHNREYKAEGAEVIHSLAEALEIASHEELWVIGGAAIYSQLLEYSDRLLVTLIDEDVDGDAYFPDFSWDNYALIGEEEGIRDEKNPYNYRFLTYARPALSEE